MRILLITLLFTILCSLTVMSFADEKSDCLNNCANEKRSSGMYCPPAGGYTDEDHKQCVAKSTTAYNDCIKSCSPSVVLPETPTTSTEPPLSLPDVRDLPERLK